MFFLFFQILVVIEPLLIDEDYYARVEGREIISNLAKVIKLLFSVRLWAGELAYIVMAGKINCAANKYNPCVLYVFLSGCWFGNNDLYDASRYW